jgi:hypothetical protein
MRYFYDTEFIEDGKTIDLISIGIVCEDGRELYLQSCEFNVYAANGWIVDNVLSHLHQCPHTRKHGGQSTRPHTDTLTNQIIWQLGDHQFTDGQCTFKDPEKAIIGAHTDCYWRTRAQMRDEIKYFFNPSDGIELWGYYADYDHVALCQLFGTMMDLPQNWPMYTRDLKQWCDDLGNPELPKQEGTEHNALADAKHNKAMWHFLKGYNS